MHWGSLYWRLVGRALLSPTLAVALLTIGWRWRRAQWYKTFPFLPVASRQYLRWRMVTAYGDYNAVPPIDELIRFVKWAAARSR